MNNSCCILFFVKYPSVGRVKTRLAETVGVSHACELYRRFVGDLLGMLKGVDSEVIICFDPHMQSEEYRRWLGEDFKYLEQNGNDIGERMKNALMRAFEDGYSKAVVIGSDSPDLTHYHIEKAFTELGENDAVIGPCSDGGYYLIGFNDGVFAEEVFEGISWSSGSEFNETINVFLKRDSYSVGVLDTWHDVDIAADLEALIARNKRIGFRKSRTYEYILNIVNRD